MDNAEAREYLARIAHALRSHGFNWVVDEVRAVIAAGKIIEKEIVEAHIPHASLDALELEEPDSGRKRKARRTSSIAFSDEEQFATLLMAIERALPDRAEIENAMFDAIVDFDAISFVPESGDIEGVSPTGEMHQVSRFDREQANTISDRTRSVLEKLRGLLNAR
jgi:hypothetical protein